MRLIPKRSRNRLALAVAFATSAVSTSAVFAQDQIEEIQITGSFISRPADRPQPVAIMDNEEIRANQRVTLTEVIRDMPQISSADVTANGLNPTNNINMRGLGSRSTLILLNGQRQTIDADGTGAGGSVDINNLAPSIMVERMELVMDGASALYGSDAVAGVANFITRNNFDGAEIQLGSQVAEAQTNVPETSIAAIFGSQGDRLGVVAAVEFQNRSDVMEAEDIRSRERLEEGLKTAYFNPGSFSPVDGSFFAKPDPLCGSTLIGGTGESRYANPAGFKSGPFCRGLLSLRRTLIPESQTFTAMAVATYDFGGDWLQQGQVEFNTAKATMRRHEGTGLPYLAQSSYGLVMPANNPGVIDANQRDPSFPLTDYRQIWSRLYSPAEGPAIMRSKQWTSRASATLDGLISDTGWDWKLRGTFSQNDQYTQDVDVIMERVVRAVAGYGGPACKWNPVLGVGVTDLEPGVGQCQWYNPFASRLIAEPGDPTYNDPRLVDWLRWGETPTGEARFFSVEGIATGELWDMAGGTTGIALGTQFRKQSLDISNDPIQKDGGFGFAPQIVYDWKSVRDTKSVFAELVMYPTEDLEIDIAARYEDTEGNSSAEPKISLLWTPTDNLYVRASAGSSFRLASEFQTYGIGEGGGSVYPIGGEVSQARGIQRGNPGLDPEESDNWTIGVTWDIDDNWTVEATWWDYEFTNLITSTNATDVLLTDIADGNIDNTSAHPLFPGSPTEVCEITGRWVPDPVNDPGNSTRPDDCATGFGFIIWNNGWINQDSIQTNGMDWTISYDTDLFGGNFGTRFLGTWVNSYKGNGSNGQLVEAVGTDGFQVAGIGTNPEVRANLITTFDKGDHSFRGTLRYTAGTKVTNPNPDVANTSDASFTQLDLTYTYALPTDNPSSVTLAVLNAGDREPPLVANGLLTSNSSIIDPRGRMWRASMNYSF